MSLGFQAEGWRSIGAVEKDAAAAETYRRMFSQERPQVFGGAAGDIREITPEGLLAALPESPALIVGGPPCQGFSRAGMAKQRSLLEDAQVLPQRDYQPERNYLYRDFFAVVRLARPLAFVVENVPGIRDSRETDIARRLAREGAALGYNVRYFLLNSAWYGVPQRRWRLFFVGLRCDLGHDAIPEPPVRTHRSFDLSEEFLAYPEDPWMLHHRDIPEASSPIPEVTVAEALRDLPRLKGHLDEDAQIPDADTVLPLKKSPSVYAQQMRTWPHHPAGKGVSDNWYRWTPRDFPLFKEMAQGDNYLDALEIAQRRFQRHLRELPSIPPAGSEAYKNLRAEFVPPYSADKFHEKWKKLCMDQPSWTVTAHLCRDGYSHIHYDSRQARTITIREAARLQSFPDGFRFSGNYGDRFRQIGNAVPPLMARAVARQLRAQLDLLGAFESAEAV